MRTTKTWRILIVFHNSNYLWFLSTLTCGSCCPKCDPLCSRWIGRHWSLSYQAPSQFWKNETKKLNLHNCWRRKHILRLGFCARNERCSFNCFGNYWKIKTNLLLFLSFVKNERFECWRSIHCSICWCFSDSIYDFFILSATNNANNK